VRSPRDESSDAFIGDGFIISETRERVDEKKGRSSGCGPFVISYFSVRRFVFSDECRNVLRCAARRLRARARGDLRTARATAETPSAGRESIAPDTYFVAGAGHALLAADCGADLKVPVVNGREFAVESTDTAVPRAVLLILYRASRVMDKTGLTAGVGMRVAPVAVCRTLHQAVSAARVVGLALVGASVNTQ